MKAFLIGFYTTCVVLLVAWTLIPSLLSARDDLQVLAGVALLPILVLTIYKVAVYISKTVLEKDKPEEDTK